MILDCNSLIISKRRHRLTAYRMVMISIIVRILMHTRKAELSMTDVMT